MFYTEEDILPVVTAAEEVFGTQAQYFPDPYVYVSVETPKYGCIWYGEINGDYAKVRELLVTLSAKIGEKVTARDLGTEQYI